jgi:DHA1 family multidrug resistance protein-like MFS transporter
MNMTAADSLKNGDPDGLRSGGNLSVIAVSTALKSFGGGLINSYVSLYFVELGGNAFTFGLTAALASLIGCISFLAGGLIADYYGRRRIMFIAAFYGAFSALLFAFIKDWRLFAAVYIVATFASISGPASSATVADSIPPEKRATGIASLQVVSSLPVTVAPLIGGWIMNEYGVMDGFRLACLFTSAFSLLSALALFYFLRETWLKSDKGKLREWLRLPRQLSSSLKGLICSYALVAFANGAVASYYILYASEVIGLTPFQWAPIASIQFLVTLLKIPGARVSDKIGKRKVMIVSLLACAPCSILFTLSHSFLQALLSILFVTATGIVYSPAYEALQADLTPKATRGRIIALWQLITSLATIPGTIAGGFLFEAVDPTLPFYLFSIAEVIAALAIIGFVKEPKKKEP